MSDCYFEKYKQNPGIREGINVDIKSNLNNDPSPAWPGAAAGVTPAG